MALQVLERQDLRSTRVHAARLAVDRDRALPLRQRPFDAGPCFRISVALF